VVNIFTVNHPFSKKYKLRKLSCSWLGATNIFAEKKPFDTGKNLVAQIEFFHFLFAPLFKMQHFQMITININTIELVGLSTSNSPELIYSRKVVYNARF